MPSLRASAGLLPKVGRPAPISPWCAVSGYAADPRTQTCDSLPVGLLSAGSSGELTPLWNSLPPVTFEGWRINISDSLPLSSASYIVGLSSDCQEQ